MRELGLFAGAGGGLLASTHLLGWRTECAVEIDPHCQAVLRQRQLDGVLDPFPIWDDINTFDGHQWRGRIDVVSGGFPCQDISSAGRGAGLDGDRSGLWFQMLRVIGECEPAFVFAENSPMLRTRGLDRILGGLADLGFDACWGVLGAWHVGAPHRRNRMWLVAAHPDRCRERAQPQHAEMAGASRAGGNDAANTHRVELWQQPRWRSGARGQGTAQPGEDSAGLGPAGDTDSERQRRPEHESAECEGDSHTVGWWQLHRFAGVDDGVASRVERIRATGNGQVPDVAALAWQVLHATVMEQYV